MAKRSPYPNATTDALEYCAERTANDDPINLALAKGVVTGMVATLMQFQRMDYMTAVEMVRRNLPHTSIDPRAIPEAWRKDILGE